MYQLAQINIGRIRAPLSDPLMAGFVENLDRINAIADASPGFVWRLQTEEGNATAVRAYEDEDILLNMSVWTSLEDLTGYVYALEGEHRRIMKERRRWFERFDGPFMALWWVPQGHIPTPVEARERLEYLRTHGETAYAFSFKKTFPTPDAPVESATLAFEECPA